MAREASVEANQFVKLAAEQAYAALLQPLRESVMEHEHPEMIEAALEILRAKLDQHAAKLRLWRENDL